MFYLLNIELKLNIRPLKLDERRYKFMSAGYFEPQELHKVPLYQFIGFIALNLLGNCKLK